MSTIPNVIQTITPLLLVCTRCREHGDYFGICVAGYPEAHPDTIIEGDDVHNEKSYWENIEYLKQKVNMGDTAEPSRGWLHSH